MADLTQKHCVPCEGGVPPMAEDQITRYLNEIGGGWQHKPGLVHKITKEFTFKDFRAAMAFVNKIANLAEREGHHPDMAIFYNKLKLELFTHAIHGLSENDFILAAKIEELA